MKELPRSIVCHTYSYISRRSKTKCTGERPQCRSCMKRKVTCSWANHSDFATSAFPKGQSMDTSMNMSISMGDAHPSASMANSSTVSDDSILHPSIPEIRGFVQERVGRLQRLFDLFLAKHHDVELCSFFHKPSLDVAALYGSDSFLVNSVCALAALYIPQEEANREYGHPSNMALSYHYTRLAKIQAAKLFDEPSGERSSLTLLQQANIYSSIHPSIPGSCCSGTPDVVKREGLYVCRDCNQNVSGIVIECRALTSYFDS